MFEIRFYRDEESYRHNIVIQKEVVRMSRESAVTYAQNIVRNMGYYTYELREV